MPIVDEKFHEKHFKFLFHGDLDMEIPSYERSKKQQSNAFDDEFLNPSLKNRNQPYIIRMSPGGDFLI